MATEAAQCVPRNLKLQQVRVVLENLLHQTSRQGNQPSVPMSRQQSFGQVTKGLLM